MKATTPLAAVIIAILAICCSTLNVAAQSLELPFSTTTIADGKFAADTHWYAISVRSGKYLNASTAEGQIACTPNVSPSAQTPEFLWAISGSEATGYRLHNYALGPDYAIGLNEEITNSAYPTMLKGAMFDTFTFSANEDGFSCCSTDATAYLNDISGKGILGYWVDSRGASSVGSRMIFAEIEMPGGGNPGGGETAIDPAELAQIIANAQTAYDANSSYVDETLIRSVDQLFCPYSHNELGRDQDGGGLEVLIDQNPSTFFHTQWQTATGGANVVNPGTHYIRVEAPELPGFSGAITVTTVRRINNYYHPTEFVVYGTNSLGPDGSDDDATWTELATIALPYDGSGTTATTQLSLADTYRYLRFNCTNVSPMGSTKSYYFHMAEFQLYSATALADDCVNAILADDAQRLAEAIAAAQVLLAEAEAGNATISQSDVDALLAAISAYNAAVDAYLNPPYIDPDAPGDTANLVINEIQVANIDQHLDPSRNYGGWIELYNPSDNDIPLEGLYVTGTNSEGIAEVPFQFRFPLSDNYDYGAVPAHGFKNIWFDHYAVYDNKPITEHEAYKQVYWKLDPDGGRVALLAADGVTEVCALTYPATLPRASYARITDGGEEWGWHASGTPEASNDGAAYLSTPLRLDPPVVSEDSHIFQNAFSVSVVIPAGTTLRYTTDGSTPTEASTFSKDGNFNVSGTKIYRFRLFADGYLPSPVVTRSWISTTASTLKQLPVLSITTADANLNSKERGIFAASSYGRTGQGAGSPTNRNMDWERPVNFEYFDLTDSGNYECVINQEANMAVCGGWTRNSNTPPPFKIKAAEQYDGQNYLLYPIFKDKPFNKNRTLQMRREKDLLDVGLQEIARRSGLYLDTQGWQPAIVYINGSSKGYIPIREPNNKHFALANYGIDTDFVDVFEVNCDSNYVQTSGTIEAFDRWYELAQRCGTDEAAYDELCQLVDIEEYLNYMATEFYIFNTDWPWNNVKGFRAHDGKFHMVLMDVGDQAFAHSGGHASPSSSPFEYFRSWQQKHYRPALGETRFVSIFFNMMQNAAIRRKFVDTFCLIAYSVYDPDFISEVMAQLAEECNGIVSDSRIVSTLTTAWQSQELKHLIALKEAGISSDDQFAIAFGSNIDEARLHLNGLPVPRQQFRGTLFAPATLTAAAPEGYDFAGWQDADGNIVCPDAEWTIAVGDNIDYGTLTATYLPASDYAQQAPIRINELSAANDIYVNEYWSRKDWIELYNATNQPIDVAGMYLSDDAAQPRKWQIPAQGSTSAAVESSASTIIPAHSTLIVWADKELAGSQLHAPFKLSNADGCSVSIAAADNTWTDRLTYKAHGARESYGRYPDGALHDYLFTIPTIAQPNHLAYYAVPTEPEGPQPTTLDLQFAAGWNWISHPFSEAQPVSLFTDGALRIRGQKDELFNDATYGWVGTLSELDTAHGYKAEYTTPTTVSLTGMLYDTEATPVSVKAGWNWIGCPMANATETNAALAGFRAAEGDAIVGLNGFSTFTGERWTGTLTHVTPGEGYLLHSAQAQSFVWNALSTIPANRRLAREHTDETTPWSVDIHAYPNVMSLIATIDDSALIVGERASDGTASSPFEGLTIGAFATADANGLLGECRGVSTLVDGRFYLNIHGENAERLTFAILDASGQTFKAVETLDFTPQSIVGTYAAPFDLSLRITPTATNIALAADVIETAIFTPAGQRIARMQPGVNIITTLFANGRTVVNKIVVGE